MNATNPRYELHCRDAIEALTRLQTASVDLITTDVAYESLEKHRKIGTTTRLKQSESSSNEWFPIFPNARFQDFFRECYRVLRYDRHMYFFCDQETMFVAKPIGEQAGFTFWKPLVWDKVAMGMGYHYRAQCEFILFFEKRKKGRQLKSRGITDIIPPADIDFVVEKRVTGYPTEKPEAVNRLLIEQSTDPGELVFDPFMGSGSAGAAALKAGRHFLGTDIVQKAVDLSRARLQAVEGSEMGPVASWALGQEPRDA